MNGRHDELFYAIPFFLLFPSESRNYKGIIKLLAVR